MGHVTKYEPTEEDKLAEEKLLAEAQVAKARIAALPLGTNEERAKAGVLLQGIKGEFRKLEKEQEKISKPAHAAWKAALALFRPRLKVLDECAALLSDRLVAAVEDAEKSAAKILAEAKTEEASTIAVVQAAEKAPEKIAGVAITSRTKYRILDKSKVPLEYLDVNHSKVQRAMGDSTEIPGIEYYQEKGTQVRT
jgi:hypothetical protein